VNVKIIEVDGERRRLSLSLKRVEDTDPVQPRADGGESVHARPQIDLSEEVFAEAPVTEAEAEAESPFELPTEEAAAEEAPTAEADATGAGVTPPAEDEQEAGSSPSTTSAAEPEASSPDE
jgi:small subunit ribosomal protein S1